jgi:hypothetical protein
MGSLVYTYLTFLCWLFYSRKKGKGKKISDFYAGQNEHIGNLLKPLKVHTEEAIADEADNAKSVRWAIRLSLYCNFALAGLQVSHDPGRRLGLQEMLI